MKKLLTILLIMVYLVPVSGITLQLHYCGGKYSSLTFMVADKTASCACGSKTMKKKGCCKNKTVYLNLKEDQKPSAHFIFSFDSAQQTTFKTFSFTYLLPVVSCSSITTCYQAPPPRYGNSLHIINNIFRI